jgi:hypothetical protein
MRLHLYPDVSQVEAHVTVTYIDAAAKHPSTARTHVLIFRGEDSAGRIYRDADNSWNGLAVAAEVCALGGFQGV